MGKWDKAEKKYNLRPKEKKKNTSARNQNAEFYTVKSIPGRQLQHKLAG